MVSILEIEDYAHHNNIPIMEKEGINYLTNFIDKKGIKTILEVGSAIGYSSIMMALVNKDIHIVTLERDEKRYQEALINIDDMDLKKQIDVVLTDALEYMDSNKYDMIFIDAAKGQYTNFFNRFKGNLKENGYIVSDNLAFHGYVNCENIESRNLRQLVNKIKKYIAFLKENDEFDTEFIDIGDGIGISHKRS